MPLLIHQPSYNLFNRWVEPDLLDALEEVGAGMIAFTALAQGLLTDKYLDGIPADARVNRPGGDSFPRESLLRGEPGPGPRPQRDRAGPRPDAGADGLRLGPARPAGDHDADRRELAGAGPGERRGRWRNLDFTPDELAEIDRYAVEGGVNLWEKPSTDQRP